MHWFKLNFSNLIVKGVSLVERVVRNTVWGYFKKLSGSTSFVLHRMFDTRYTIHAKNTELAVNGEPGIS